jgi:hypothetical protein
LQVAVVAVKTLDLLVEQEAIARLLLVNYLVAAHLRNQESR